MPEGRRPRGVTTRPRLGAAAESARLRRRRNGQEELPGGREELPCVRGQGWCLRPRAAAGRSNPTPKARGGGREGQPHVQGVVAVRAQEGLEEPSHVESLLAVFNSL